MSSLSSIGSPRPSHLPYRAPREGLRNPEKDATEGPVRVALAIFWLISLGRVVGAIIGHEVFGAEATLALMATVGVPVAWWTSRRR